MHDLDLLVNQQASQASDSLSPPFVCGQVCAHMQACKPIKKEKEKKRLFSSTGRLSEQGSKSFHYTL